jgi:drug/metabolite transporter (DMT)-like permease
MSSSESPLIHTIGHDYGSTQSTSGTSQDDGAIDRRPNVPGFIANNTGMLYIISSQFFFASMSLSVKMLNSLEPPVHAFEVIVVRMGITLTCCMTYMIVAGVPNPIIGPRGVRKLLVIRGVTGFFGLCGLYLSLQYLSVADATVLTFLTPLSTAVAGCLLLKEGYSVTQAVAGVCSLLGVVLIARPPFLFNSMPAAMPVGHHLLETTPAQRMLAVGASMMGVVGGTGAYTSIRAIGKRAHPMHVMTFFSLWCTIIASLGMVVFNIPVVYPRSWRWSLLLFMVGVYGFAAQTLLTLGLQRETVSRGSTGVYFQMLFAVVLERLILGVVPSLLSVLGAAIIMSSALCVVLTKREPTLDSTTDSHSTA